MIETYARQISLPEIGLEGQRRLSTSSVLVIGVGGLGSAALPYLAASGIKRIGMIDFDRIERSNLARQTLFGERDIGRCKVEVAREHLVALYPEVDFQAKICQLTSENAGGLIFDYDIILDGTDNLEARLAINDASSSLQKPWIYGSIHQWQGQVSLFLPKHHDYRSLFPKGSFEPPLSNCSSGGVLGPFVGLIGAIQALEAIKYLVGLQETLAGKLLLLDGKTLRSTVVHLSPPSPSYEISYSQLKRWMLEESIQLIDAREPFTSTSFTKEQKVVVYCQRGKRSLAFMHQLRGEGFEAYSLEGGVNAIDHGNDEQDPFRALFL
jgi:adenylyltransferase/sulfurtransferase